MPSRYQGKSPASVSKGRGLPSFQTPGTAPGNSENAPGQLKRPMLPPKSNNIAERLTKRTKPKGLYAGGRQDNPVEGPTNVKQSQLLSKYVNGDS